MPFQTVTFNPLVEFYLKIDRAGLSAFKTFLYDPEGRLAEEDQLYYCSLYTYPCFPLLLLKLYDMQILLVLHNLIRWLILIVALWTVISAISGMAAKREYTVADGRSNFFFMLGMDIQLLIGLILYFSNGWFGSLKHIGESMKDPMVRFFTVEHSLMMIIAWILVHAGRISVKKAATAQAKFKKTFLFFGIALLLILVAIPWPFREAIARPWFRWF